MDPLDEEGTLDAPVTVVKRLRKRNVQPHDVALDLEVEPPASPVLVPDTESVHDSAPSSSPFQVASAKASSGRAFPSAKPLPGVVRRVQPRFHSPFQLGSTKAVHSFASSPVSAYPRPAAPAQAPLQLPAYLPLHSSRSVGAKANPLPRPAHRDAAFYARYPESSSDSKLSEKPALLTAPPAAEVLPTSKVPQIAEWRPPAPKSGAGFVSNRAVHQARSSVVLGLFVQVCALFRPLSRILASIQSSMHAEDLQARLLDKVADTTALRYLRSVLLFVQTAEDLGGSLLALSESMAVDVIFVLHRAGEGPLAHPSNVLKAIRWAARTLEPDPFPNLWSALFGIFSGSGCSERRESIPLPCAFLCWVERSFLGP